jgi:hypothetical protein
LRSPSPRRRERLKEMAAMKMARERQLEEEERLAFKNRFNSLQGPTRTVIASVNRMPKGIPFRPCYITGLHVSVVSS